MSRAKLRRFFRHGLLPQLLVFEAVARLGSVTRAAAELHLAQPTISLQLKKLAQTLEVALFEQRGRNLHLTAAGRQLRESCNELLAMVTRLEDKLAPFRAPQAESLRLAAEPDARAVAARLIAEFCARNPGVQVGLHVAERAELLSRFAAGTDDVYLFGLEVEGLPEAQRWSLLHVKGRALARSAALFLRESLLYNGAGKEEDNGDTARLQRGDRPDRP
jgi:LysR family transcriptional regulator, low CO2-responsive transcriptional regulator